MTFIKLLPMHTVVLNKWLDSAGEKGTAANNTVVNVVTLYVALLWMLMFIFKQKHLNL